jgi:hypothetical protein
MLKLPYTQYKWQKWDCFTLANYVRKHIDGLSLPDINEDVYSKYTEQTQPNDLVETIVKKYCKPATDIATGYIVILKINGVSNLGTIYKNSIIYMGVDSANSQPIDRLAEYIDSIWVYQPF